LDSRIELRMRIAHDDAHARRHAQLGKALADLAVADDADGGPVELPAHGGRWDAARAVFERGFREAASEVHHRADHPLGHRGDEPRARLRHEDALAARRLDVDVADVDRAAREGDDVGDAVEELRGPWRPPVRDDELAAL